MKLFDIYNGENDNYYFEKENVFLEVDKKYFFLSNELFYNKYFEHLMYDYLDFRYIHYYYLQSKQAFTRCLIAKKIKRKYIYKLLEDKSEYVQYEAGRRIFRLL